MQLDTPLNPNSLCNYSDIYVGHTAACPRSAKLTTRAQLKQTTSVCPAIRIENTTGKPQTRGSIVTSTAGECPRRVVQGGSEVTPGPQTQGQGKQDSAERRAG